MYNNIPYRSFIWNLGTTSFRTKKFNFSNERLLQLLDAFWKKDEFADLGWEKEFKAPNQKDIYEVKNQFYFFMQREKFVDGNDKTPYKAAREKTSGLRDLGLINQNHRLTEVGNVILDISQNKDYNSDNKLGISKDSYIYLKQLLKLCWYDDKKQKEVKVRPFIVLTKLLGELEYLTYDEFTYLAPLCTDYDFTKYIISYIRDSRKTSSSYDNAIIQKFMSQQNYRKAYKLLMENPESEELITTVGMNRKGRRYDKPYYLLYNQLKSYFLEKKDENISLLIKAVNNINIGNYWRQLLFKTSSKSAIIRKPKENIKQNPFTNVSSIEEFKKTFFITMHLFKAKATMHDYFDLNRRYLGITNVILFDDSVVKFDIIPKHFFKTASDELFKIAFIEDEKLELNCKMQDICPALVFNEKEIIKGINFELHAEITNLDDVYNKVESVKYQRFRKMVDTQFTDDKLLKLLDNFEQRQDDVLMNEITDNADVPTLFEYVLGVIWYKVSEYEGKILDYLKLSLDAKLLPVTHAAGGEADIVYKYNANPSYYPQHSLLLEATLSSDVNQRRMEMEPVSRHVGNYIIRDNNMNDYGIFITTYLDPNVISDFRNRKTMTFYDTTNCSKFINGMKIIPLKTSDLKNIIRSKKKYKDLYGEFEKAYKFDDRCTMPIDWYNKYIKQNLNTDE